MGFFFLFRTENITTQKNTLQQNVTEESWTWGQIDGYNLSWTTEEKKRFAPCQKWTEPHASVNNT